MSAHVLLNLLNELGKKIRCEALPSILSVLPNEFNFALKRHDFAIRKHDDLWTSTHIVTT